MARVTAVEVKQIMDNSQLEDYQVDPFVTAANEVVTDLLGSSGLGSTLLKEIERWFTAHLIASSKERVARREEIDDVMIEYTGRFGSHLSSTPYGQVVETLDSTGKMSNAGNKEAGLWAVETG